MTVSVPVLVLVVPPAEDFQIVQSCEDFGKICKTQSTLALTKLLKAQKTKHTQTHRPQLFQRAQGTSQTNIQYESLRQTRRLVQLLRRILRR